jgi:hypothetical protein
MSYEKLLRALNNRGRRKLDFQRTRRYNLSMSRTQMLAKALGGEVIEDVGYRGVINVRGEYMRYHVSHGVTAVSPSGRQWRHLRTVMTPEEVDPFLEEAGLLPRQEPKQRPVDALAALLGGEVVAKFQAGGGVVRTPQGLYVRFSNVTGLDIVTYVVSKWRSVRHLADRTEFLRLLHENPHKVAELVSAVTAGQAEPAEAAAPQEVHNG